jgi:hypothetical protein
MMGHEYLRRLGRKRSWFYLKYSNYLGIYLKELRKTKRTLVSEIGIPAEIRTNYLPHRVQNPYLLSQLARFFRSSGFTSPIEVTASIVELLPLDLCAF